MSSLSHRPGRGGGAFSCRGVWGALPWPGCAAGAAPTPFPASPQRLCGCRFDRDPSRAAEVSCSRELFGHFPHLPISCASRKLMCRFPAEFPPLLFQTRPLGTVCPAPRAVGSEVTAVCGSPGSPKTVSHRCSFCPRSTKQALISGSTATSQSCSSGDILCPGEKACELPPAPSFISLEAPSSSLCLCLAAATLVCAARTDEIRHQC